MRGAKPARCIRFIQGLGGQYPMQFEDQFQTQGTILDFADSRHGRIVVEDHALIPVTRLASIADHVFRHLTRRSGAFQLAGSDRLFNQRGQDITLAPLGRNHFGVRLNLSGRIPIDSMQPFQHRIRHAESKGPASHILERQVFTDRVTRQLGAQPLFFGTQVRRRRSMT